SAKSKIRSSTDDARDIFPEYLGNYTTCYSASD
ncbi:DUF3800 domain-containing protein, partial [Mobiluncus mulieris]|nr:DUF3800 domain-containing protein [Mobiluncus mulieris]